MPNRTPPGRKAECVSACHLAEMAINDEKTAITARNMFNRFGTDTAKLRESEHNPSLF
jgi:hypothetical protein